MDTSHVAPEASPPAVAVQGLKTSNDGHGALVLIPQPSGSPDDPLVGAPVSVTNRVDVSRTLRDVLS